jgi:hypothetical protein
MKRFLLLLIVLSISLFANETFNMKKCETIKLSTYTALVSCHKLDYLIEYRKVDDEEKDTVKKITVITPTSQKVIKSLRNTK